MPLREYNGYLQEKLRSGRSRKFSPLIAYQDKKPRVNRFLSLFWKSHLGVAFFKAFRRNSEGTCYGLSSERRDGMTEGFHARWIICWLRIGGTLQDGVLSRSLVVSSTSRFQIKEPSSKLALIARFMWHTKRDRFEKFCMRTQHRTANKRKKILEKNLMLRMTVVVLR